VSKIETLFHRKKVNDFRHIRTPRWNLELLSLIHRSWTNYVCGVSELDSKRIQHKFRGPIGV